MANEARRQFIDGLRKRFPSLRKLPGSQSLYEIGKRTIRVYIRYSKLHPRNQTFYGLRAQDLRELDGCASFVCFLWDGQAEPLLIPYVHYEDVFESTSPARDGQYKTQVYLQPNGTEMYIAGAGRFNVESYFGWGELEAASDPSSPNVMPALNHRQVQALLGSIGSRKGYDIWIPPTDRAQLDFSLSVPFESRRELPLAYSPVAKIIQEIDVLWIQRGSSDLRALFEVEHSTPIYSGLLRFNDVYLGAPKLDARFSIVANDARRSLFVQQLNRPTFRASGLQDICSFLDYADVYGWHRRVVQAA